jgi:hypothetical protein
VLVIEGSGDGGRTWLPYDFKYVCTRRKQPPGFVALVLVHCKLRVVLLHRAANHQPSLVSPFHARLDHVLFYHSVGFDQQDFLVPVRT